MDTYVILKNSKPVGCVITDAIHDVIHVVEHLRENDKQYYCENGMIDILYDTVVIWEVQCTPAYYTDVCSVVITRMDAGALINTVKAMKDVFELDLRTAYHAVRDKICPFVVAEGLHCSVAVSACQRLLDYYIVAKIQGEDAFLRQVIQERCRSVPV